MQRVFRPYKKVFPGTSVEPISSGPRLPALQPKNCSTMPTNSNREKSVNSLPSPSKEGEGISIDTSPTPVTHQTGGHGYTITGNWPEAMPVSDDEIDLLLSHLGKDIQKLLSD